MNRVLMIVAIALSSIITLQAQSIANNDTSKLKNRVNTQPAVTKGYYSIYKNADKLNHSGALVSIATSGNETAVIQPEKGYYSMSNHHRKLYKSGVSFIAKKQKRPVASKGYYNMSVPPANELTKSKPRKIELSEPVSLDSVFAVAD